MLFPWNDLVERLTGGYIANHSHVGVCREMLQHVVPVSSKEQVIQKLADSCLCLHESHIFKQRNDVSGFP